MLAVVAALLHRYEVPPLAVKVAVAPEQMLFVPVTTAVGLAFTVNVLLLVAVQPLAFVAVTV
jgi:hypothetical protein